MFTSLKKQRKTQKKKKTRKRNPNLNYNKTHNKNIIGKDQRQKAKKEKLFKNRNATLLPEF
jgi:hypothetical protein